MFPWVNKQLRVGVLALVVTGISPILMGSYTGYVGRLGRMGPAINGEASIVTVTTESSITPTASTLIVPSGMNAMRIWTGNQSVSEAFFDLYVKQSSSGLTSQLRLYRYTGRIFIVTAGETLSFGTSNGRTIYLSFMTVPGTLTAPSGATGTALCDKAGPSGTTELWHPSAPHIILPTTHAEFILESDGTERVIFLREFSGTSWTPIRFIRLPSSTDVTVRATYKKIALAEYTGASVGITAPTGTIIGGTSTTMSFGIIATGTTRIVTANSESDFRAKLALAVSGDEVVLPAGTYTLTTAVSATTFTANVAAGNVGGEGIIIRGATGTRGDVVIVPANSAASFSFTQTGATDPFLWKDLTVNFTGVSSSTGFVVTNGVIRLENVALIGGALGDNLTANQVGGTLNLKVLFSDSSDATADCWNTDGDNTADSASSIVQYTASTGARSGSASSHQVLTTHDSLGIEVWGGTYSDAHTSLIANGGTVPTNYLFFVSFSDGTRVASIFNSSLFFCTRTIATSTSGQIDLATGGYAIGHHEINTTFIAGSPVFRQTSAVTGGTFIGNLVELALGRAFQASIGSTPLSFNIFKATDSAGSNSAGIHLAAWTSGSVADTVAYNNTLTGLARALRITDDDLPILMKNNAAFSNSNSIIFENTADGTDAVGNYNVLDSTVSASYVAGANDTIAQDAALNATTYLPTASGNCDLNGDGSLYSWVGGIDPFGFVAIYKLNAVSRGARTIPNIYAGAQLFPELR